MSVVFVHGVPDTYRLWDKLRALLQRRDVVAVALPGFDTPIPAGFSATKEAYVEWLIAEIERLGAPVDLVAHDWGATLVQRVVSLRPDLVRTWATGSGVVDVEYEWHDIAKQWQTPEVGEALMAVMSPDTLSAALAATGVPEDAAEEAARHFDERMKACILRLYRSAVDVGAEWQGEVARVTRPALVFWGEKDPYAGPHIGERLAARVRGELIVFKGCGHWWPVERPAEAAAALERFWTAQR